MKAKAIAQKATDLVGGDRKEAYGDVIDGLTKIAVYWNAELEATGNAPPRPLAPADVAKFMILLKLARADTGPFRIDNYVDMSGWSAIAGEAASRSS